MITLLNARITYGDKQLLTKLWYTQDTIKCSLYDMGIRKPMDKIYPDDPEIHIQYLPDSPQGQQLSSLITCRHSLMEVNTACRAYYCTGDYRVMDRMDERLEKGIIKTLEDYIKTAQRIKRKLDKDPIRRKTDAR
ncbi:hypothetical protein NE570_19965 [Eubacterium callanderi]|nr:hypothetical protein [Eubacterium callanderi]